MRLVRGSSSGREASRSLDQIPTATLEKVAELDRGAPVSDPNTPRLALENIRVQFGEFVALDELSLTVGKGEICGLIGPNGAGKTTLFDVVSGVRRPQRGRILMDGVDISRLSPSRRCWKGLRRSFQRVQTFGWLTVEDNILAATEWRGGGGGLVADLAWSPTRRRRERERGLLVDAALERCGLTAVRKEYAGSLPIGISRMVEFARATVEPPALLLLDEPASGLDADEVMLLADLIRSVRLESECAVLVVEHDAEFIMQLSDRAIVLDRGKMLAEGTPDEIRSNAAVQTAYLGTDMATGSRSE
jgi:branched-chain amino acid transport system ATP-binding protein